MTAPLSHATIRHARVACALATGLFLLGCATPKPPDEENTKAPPPKLVGIIASIPPDRRFVLIQSYGTWDTPTGTILTTRGEQKRTANLLFTGEKLGRFAAADIQSGTVEKGDAVYSRHTPKPEITATETPPTPQPEPAPSNQPAPEPAPSNKSAPEPAPGPAIPEPELPKQ